MSNLFYEGFMRSSNSLAFAVLLSLFVSASCGRDAAPPASSSAGALVANSSSETPVARRFDRQVLSVSGLHSLSEFIRPDVRGRLDEEAIGDADSSFDPGAIDAPAAEEQPPVENSDAQIDEVQPAVGTDEDTAPVGSSNSAKFLWAKKSFGDAVKAQPTNNGVIVLYADENLYDVNAFMAFMEHGRDRIAEESGIPGDRLQVVFGGYRGVPQVELWLVPDGAAMPEFKPDDRSKTDDLQN